MGSASSSRTRTTNAQERITVFNFDVKRFVDIQSGAVEMASRIDDVISGCIARGARNVVFLGTGGAGILHRCHSVALRNHQGEHRGARVLP